jgi:hypothetical protein
MCQLVVKEILQTGVSHRIISGIARSNTRSHVIYKRGLLLLAYSPTTNLKLSVFRFEGRRLLIE